MFKRIPRRKPLSNFFIKKELQIRLIRKIVFAVLIATLVSIATLLLTYIATYKSAVFYRVTLESSTANIGNRENIAAIILPSLVISGIVNIIIAFCIGLYASRKYAVPIYKLEQWVQCIRDGHITAQLRFREKEELHELSKSCNALSDGLREKFKTIEHHIRMMRKDKDNTQALDTIEQALKGLDLYTETIEVHTSYIHTKDVSRKHSITERKK